VVCAAVVVMVTVRPDAGSATPSQWHDGEVFGDGVFAGNPMMMEFTLHRTRDDRDQGKDEL
jgi:hypothetical protein